MNEQQSTIRCGTKYYRFAIKQTRLGGLYLEVMECPVNAASPPKEQRLYVFPEYATKFAIVLNRMVLALETASQDAPDLSFEADSSTQRMHVI